MPVYDYLCRGGICDGHTEVRSISERDLPARCPSCQLPADRMLQAPRLSVMPAPTRTAHATNERNSHEPASTRSRGHGRGCGCCASKTGTDRPAAPKSFANRRPWMISH